jgi:hypothetical protein
MTMSLGIVNREPNVNSCKLSVPIIPKKTVQQKNTYQGKPLDLTAPVHRPALNAWGGAGSMSAVRGFRWGA